ncbi:MAG TPA: hypothetical protein VGK90_05380 [Rhizomicrobium sp.]|jgi:hypothetical protein
MMLKLTSAFGAICALALTSAPVLAQKTSDPADSYMAGVDFGRTLLDARQCTGSGDYHAGCVAGVEESRFDREANQALDSTVSDEKSDGSKPAVSAPADMFQDPFSKPGDAAPPNN